MVSDYKRIVDRIDLRKEADAPIKTLKNIIDDLENIVIEPYLESQSTQAKEKLQIIKKHLKDINEKVEELIGKSNLI